MERVFHMRSQTHGEAGGQPCFLSCGAHYSNGNLVDAHVQNP